MKITIPTIEDIKVWLGKKTEEISEAEYVRKAVESRTNITQNSSDSLLGGLSIIPKLIIFGMPIWFVLSLVTSDKEIMASIGVGATFIPIFVVVVAGVFILFMMLPLLSK